MKTKVKLLTFIIVLFLPLVVISQEKEKGIFHYLDKQAVDLDERQQELFDVIRSWPQTKNVHLIQVEKDRFDVSLQTLQINLPDRIIEAEKTESDTQNISEASWSGSKEVDNSASTILLSVDNDDLTGHIQVGDQMYSIRPLTGGIQALIELDPTKFDKEAPPVIPSDSIEEDEESFKKGQSLHENSSRKLSSDPIIDVLVAYTPQAKANAGNIGALINQAGDLGNISFGNSDISASINVVAMVEVDYTESGDASMDLNRLRLTSDGHMEEVHPLRGDFNADLVALITGSMNACGIAYMPDPQDQTPSWGFSVTRYDCITGHTFSHEIGHNLGANHDVDNIPDNDPTESPFEYGHGYRFTHSNTTYRTIMAYSPGSRINYWSNPDINYQGSGPAMGTAQYEDNARVWEERAPVVADFFPSSDPLVFSNGYTVPDDSEITIPAGMNVEFQDNLIVPQDAQLRVTTENITFDSNAEIVVENGGELILDNVQYEDIPMVVQTGGTLYLEPGVHLSYSSGEGLSVDGQLEMNGTSANPVTFSATGGGDWDGIDLYGSGSSLNHVEVEDAENGITAFNLSGLELSNLKVTGSSQDGIRLINSTLSGLSGYINAEDNSRYGLYVDGQSNSGLNNNTLKNNSSGQLVIDGGGSFTNISNTLATNTGAGTNGLMAMDNSHIQISSSSIYDNPVNDAYAIQNSTIDAQSNWWGQAPPSGDQFYEDATSDIDYSNHLFWDPLPSGQSQQLAAATHVEPT